MLTRSRHLSHTYPSISSIYPSRTPITADSNKHRKSSATAYSRHAARTQSFPYNTIIRFSSSNTTDSSESSYTKQPSDYFPWNHSPHLTRRFEEKDDLSGMPNNFRARFVRRMIAGRELNLGFWDIIPVPFERGWEAELASNFSTAYGLALTELLKTVFQVPVSNDFVTVSIDSSDKSMKDKIDATARTTEGIAHETKQLKALLEASDNAASKVSIAPKERDFDAESREARESLAAAENKLQATLNANENINSQIEQMGKDLGVTASSAYETLLNKRTSLTKELEIQKLGVNNAKQLVDTIDLEREVWLRNSHADLVDEKERNGTPWGLDSDDNDKDDASLSHNEYLNSMMDQNLLARYQLVDKDSIHLKLTVKPISAKLGHIFAIPLLTRDIVNQKPHLKGGYLRIERAFEESKSYDTVREMTHALADEVGRNSFKRTVVAEATIQCLEFFQVKDATTGNVLRGMQDGDAVEEVVHVVRFEVMTDKREDGKMGREVGNWKIIDWDDLLEGNSFH